MRQMTKLRDRKMAKKDQPELMSLRQQLLKSKAAETSAIHFNEKQRQQLSLLPLMQPSQSQSVIQPLLDHRKLCDRVNGVTQKKSERSD